MASIKSLAKDTAIYGMSSIVGRFLNYLLVPLYTNKISAESGGYGVVTNLYAYTALIFVILTFGMETSFFRFANKEGADYRKVFSTSLFVVATLSIVFLAGVFGFISPLSNVLGYGDHKEYIMMMATVIALDSIQAVPFALLRFKKRPYKFAALKLLFIFLNIGLNLLYFLVLGKTQPVYIFMLNLVCTSIVTFFFIPEFKELKFIFDKQLLKQMLSYSWPILVLGIAGILNQTADKILFPLIYPDESTAQQQLGIYGACVKLAMIMTLITQAFRYAYEPFVFAQNREKDSKQTYALAMKYFIIVTLLAFLCVVGYMDILKHFIGAGYREGLRVVPIVMAAEIMMGIALNLSIWYKLTDKTIWGAIVSIIGCTALFAINIIFVPLFGYMAAAWGGFAAYAITMILSYFLGQKYYPVNYPLKEIALYTLLAIILFVLMTYIPQNWNTILRIIFNTLMIGIFAACFFIKDLWPAVKNRLHR